MNQAIQLHEEKNLENFQLPRSRTRF